MSENPESEKVSMPDEDETDANYKPPPEMTLCEILDIDKDDESLQKYKEKLLGSSVAKGYVIDENDPRRVIVKTLALVVEGRPDVELDLAGDISQLKSQVFTIKEGVRYRLRIDFHVQREIVTGLKYVQKTQRKGIQVDKMTQMVGSYAPRAECHSFLTASEESPSGVFTRGIYNVKSLFTDDDKNEHLKWAWMFEIKKDWE